jgi:hypothetical protein
MGKTYRGDDRNRHKENYLRFKDKRSKRSIRDEDTSKREERKNNDYRDYNINYE